MFTRALTNSMRLHKPVSHCQHCCRPTRLMHNATTKTKPGLHSISNSNCRRPMTTSNSKLKSASNPVSTNEKCNRNIFVRMYHRVSDWQARNTLLGCMLVSGLKASAADMLVQRVQHRTQSGHGNGDDGVTKSHGTSDSDSGSDANATGDGQEFQLDVRRHVAFVAFGLLYGGAFQYLIFNRMLP